MEAPIARIAQHPPAASPAGGPLAAIQEDAVVKLAGLLGKDEKTTDPFAAGNQIKALYAAEMPENNVVLLLPSLDIQVSENAASALPGLGQTSRPTPTGNVDMQSALSNSADRPAMAASVLASATKDAADAEQEVAKSLSNSTSWTKSTVAFAQGALVNNICASFSRLVHSRMKAWTLLLLRHSLSTGDGSSRQRLLGILGASLKVESAYTKFRTLPLPDSAKGHHKEAEVILPLLFEAKITMESKEEKNQPVTLRAPGTISGTRTSLIICFPLAEIQLA